MKLSILTFILLTIGTVTFAQNNITTTAEKTNYASTSTYNDVLNFFNELNEKSQFIKIDTLAISTEGRFIPLVIIANPMVNNLSEINNRIVVYIQANIHAGEVEGKEATQMLARKLLKNHNSEILKNVVVLLVPILNVDGNEKFSLKNRTNQNGPINGVGVRYNGQHLDLNRDATKLESPEIVGVIENILNKWDPAITVDCHTTNGSFHEEPITFTWMMNPNCDSNLITYMRDDMMPKIHNTLWNSYHVPNIYFGEFIDKLNMDLGWVSYASEPRYLVNYIGIRNRLSILNENYVYADFKTRVESSFALLQTILEYAGKNSKQILTMLAKADKKTITLFNSSIITDSFAIKYKGYPTPEPITILAYETDTIPGVKGYRRYKKSNRKRTVTIPYIAEYKATKNIKFPYAYIIDDNEKAIIPLLKKHGIKVRRLKNDTKIYVESFKISKLAPATRINQGHYTNIVDGNYEIVKRSFKAGTYVVPMNQKLAYLISTLLEPEADDSFFKWNYFDRYLVPQWGNGYYPYPVYRVTDKKDFDLLTQ